MDVDAFIGIMNIAFPFALGLLIGMRIDGPSNKRGTDG